MAPRHPVPGYRDLVRRRAHDLREHHQPGRVHFTWNARGALFQLLTELSGRARGTILVPAFHCIALIKPILAAGFAIGFYRIRPDLTIEVDDLAARLNPEVAAVVVIHYFGFPADLNSVQPLVRTCGALLIEDCSHSFLTRDAGRVLGQRGDYAVFSYYKCAPSEVGGGLVANHGTPLPIVASAGAAWPVQLAVVHRWLKQADARTPLPGMATLLRGLGALARRGLAERGRALVARGAHRSNAMPRPGFLGDPYRFEIALARASLPWYARRIVESAPWDEIAHTRRRNYLVLSRLIPDSGSLRRLIPELPDGVVPYVFPVFFRNRRRHEQALRDARVPLLRFGEVLHSAAEHSRDAAWRDAEELSGSLLLLPVHQELTPRQIEEYVALLLHFVARIPPED